MQQLRQAFGERIVVGSAGMTFRFGRATAPPRERSPGS